jgi:hypothetical protein
VKKQKGPKKNSFSGLWEHFFIPNNREVAFHGVLSAKTEKRTLE